MIDNADWIFVSLVALIVAAAAVAARRSVAAHFARDQKAKLFKVRDDLILLVGRGMLSEDDKIFQHFYRATNNALKYSNHINLKTFVAALSKLRSEGIDPAEERNLQELKAALEGKDRTVKAAVDEYFRAIIDLLVENSWQLPILIRFTALVDLLKSAGGALKVTTVNREAYGFYLDYSKAAASFA